MIAVHTTFTRIWNKMSTKHAICKSNTLISYQRMLYIVRRPWEWFVSENQEGETLDDRNFSWLLYRCIGSLHCILWSEKHVLCYVSQGSIPSRDCNSRERRESIVMNIQKAIVYAICCRRKYTRQPHSRTWSSLYLGLQFVEIRKKTALYNAF